MLEQLYESMDSPVTMIIISVAVMLLAGFLLTRITKRLKLPNVTAYIVAGILIGPFGLRLVPQTVIEGTEFLADIALAFIAFSTGEFFKLDAIRKNGVRVVLITLAEALTATLAVFVLTYFVLGLNLAFSVVLAALASATAPASTMMTIRQTGAKGDFVDTLLQVVALDDVVGLLAYSIAVSMAVASMSGGSFSVGAVLKPMGINLAIMLLGSGFGVIMKFTAGSKKRSTDNRLIIVIALLFAFCGICAAFDVSPLLGCMTMGMVYINITDDDKLFKQVNYFSPPILLLFFVRSGMSFDLEALVSASGSVGSTPLLVIGVLYFFVRILGKYGGAYLGCLWAGKPAKVRNYLGLALVPQAGIAVGLAALGARTLGGEAGDALQTIILASSVLYELIGPACAKLSLYLSGAYSNKIEELVEVERTAPDGTEKTQLELLIERINRIQEQMPAREIDENEQAFTNAAEEHYEALMRPRNIRWRRR